MLRISGHYITSQRTFNDTYLTSQEPTVHTISEPQTLNAAAGLTQGSPTNTPQPAAPTQAQLAIPSADDPFYSSPEFLQELDHIETLAR